MSRALETETDPVAIYYAANLAAADVVRTRLEQAGIPAQIEPSRLPTADEDGGVSSIRVLVARKHAEAAQKLLQMGDPAVESSAPPPPDLNAI
jgi:hypothetical protein